MLSNLICYANNCAFNKSGSCYASNIKIDGIDASSSNETYCDTFRNNTAFNLSNYTESLSITNTQNITCNASTCAHNMFGGCNALSVNINLSDENCDTFISR